jgi:general L-amino acid transport system substrate-binding protein
MRFSHLLAGGAVLAIASLSAEAHAGDTLDAIKARGEIRCGVSTGLAGFSLPDAQGNWTGLDADVCRAIAPPSWAMPMPWSSCP